MVNNTVTRIVALGGIIVALVAGIVGASYHWSDIAIVAVMVAIVTIVTVVSELAKSQKDANGS